MNVANLLDSLLPEITGELKDENTVAIVLTGSHARGDATPYSDVDVLHFVEKLPEDETQHYVLRYHSGTLLSVSAATIAAKRAELSRPNKAIRAVPGLRQSRILYDPDDAFAELQKEAQAFVWDSAMQEKADAFAAYQLMGYAEEAHKILGGLSQNSDSAVLYGAYGMVLGIVNVVSAQRGVFFQTENDFFRAVPEAVGTDTDWSTYLRIAAGLEHAPKTSPSPARMRGLAALRLYVETVKLLRTIISRYPEYQQVAEHAVEAIIATEFNLSSENQDLRG